MSERPQLPDRYKKERAIPSLIRAAMLALLALALVGCGGGPPPQDPVIDSEHGCAESAFISITSPDTSEMRLSEWVLSDASGEYRLPDLRLAPGDTMRVWRGIGQGDDHNIYLGQPDVTWMLPSGGDILAVERRNFWTLFGRVEIYYLGYCSTSLSY